MSLWVLNKSRKLKTKQTKLSTDTADKHLCGSQRADEGVFASDLMAQSMRLDPYFYSQVSCILLFTLHTSV